jgi:hypothetical protein
MRASGAGVEDDFGDVGPWRAEAGACGGFDHEGVAGLIGSRYTNHHVLPVCQVWAFIDGATVPNLRWREAQRQLCTR